MVSIIVGTAVTGLLFLAVVLFMARGMRWRSYEFSFGRERETTGEALARYVQHPATWSLAFLLFVFVVAGAALAAVGALSLPVPGGMAAVGLVVALLVVVGGVFGTYGYIRSLGRSASEAAVMALLVFGFLFITFLSANLVLDLLG